MSVILFGKEYNNAFFTADEHYGSERAILLSRRLPFIHDGKADTELMDKTLIENFNSVVTDDDITIHIGDFGDRKNVKKLNGDHVLILGNYEIDEMDEYNKNGGNYVKWKDSILDDGFKDYTRVLYILHGTFKIGCLENLGIYVCHKPSACVKTQRLVYNLFGHIHEKRKIAKYGLNVGVDGNFFFPYSVEDVEFYINAIINHYDSEVYI